MNPRYLAIIPVVVLAPLARLIPDSVITVILTVGLTLMGLACLGGYLFRRKWQREGKWQDEHR